MGAHLGPRPTGNVAYINADPSFNAVSLLLHGDGTNGAQNNTFLDGSTNNFTITRTGNVTQGSFSPFVLSGAYSTSVNGGSMYFDGTGDYLTLPSNTAFTFATGNFTVELWFNASSYKSFGVLFSTTALYTTASNIYLQTNSPGTSFVVSSAGPALITDANTFNLNTWYHIAVVRNATTMTLYVNGVSRGSVINTANFTSDTPIIGSVNTTTYPVNGYISNLRLVKGAAVYTAAFTPPTAPLTAITNTSLLLSGTNAGIFDNAAKNNLETVGNAQVSTSVTKFGTGSMSFDGTGDWLTTPDKPEFNFGSGNFTIEFWVNPISWFGSVISKNNSFVIYRNNSISTTKMGVRFNNSDGTDFFSTNDVPVGSWSYWALVRNGDVFTWYLNGVSSGSTTQSITLTSNTNPVTVGQSTTFNIFLNGYIDDLRITKGVARYTANFTPPTTAFLNQ